MKVKNTHVRNALIFKQRLDLAKINRIKLGTDKELLSTSRLTKAIAEDPDFELLMRKIERKPRKESLL
jgi:hypothetical protein